MKRPVSRRKFLQVSALSCISAPFISRSFYLPKANNSYINNIGLQLYTVRDLLVSEPMKALATIQQLGYKQVELFNAETMPKMMPPLKELGLAVNSMHFASAFVTRNWEIAEALGAKRPPASFTMDTVIENAQKYGLKFLVFPYLQPAEHDSLDKIRKLAQRLNKAGEKCKAAGIQLCYHNHAFEFEPIEGTTIFEVLAAETDPELLKFEIDTFWVSVAGLDPVEFIKKNQDRVSLLHIKDKKEGTPVIYNEREVKPDTFKELGNGSMDIKAILSTAEEIGVTHCFVEQDQSPDPLNSIKESINYLKGLKI